MSKQFHFYTSLTQLELLGKRARNLIELLEGIKVVSKFSIYHHTHKFLQQHQFLSPEPPNDFAFWVGSILKEFRLGERLASIDIIRFHNINELRGRLAKIIEDHLKSKPPLIDCPPGTEFHFMGCRSLVLPTGDAASDTEKFMETLKRLSVHSLCFHIFEVRIRLGREENDFSAWFRSQGKGELADAISRLDPYTYTLEGLRKKILSLVERYG